LTDLQKELRSSPRAAEIIQRYGHNQIDTEHILLALIEQSGGVIPQILDMLKIDIQSLSDGWIMCCEPVPKRVFSVVGRGRSSLPHE